MNNGNGRTINVDENDDDLFGDITRYLRDFVIQDMLRFAKNRENIMTADRYLTDFSLAWKGVPDADPPKWFQDETAKYLKEQSKTSTLVDFGEGVSVSYDDAIDLVRVHSARGDVDIPREVCQEVGRLLVSLARPEPMLTTAGDASTLRSTPKGTK